MEEAMTEMGGEHACGPSLENKRVVLKVYYYLSINSLTRSKCIDLVVC